MAQLEVDLVDAEGKVWSGQAHQVTAPAADGEIGILPGHTPVLSLLRAGEVRVREERCAQANRAPAPAAARHPPQVAAPARDGARAGGC